ADARQVLDAAAADEDDRVLLEVVADARDIGRDLDPGGQPHARDLTQGRVRLLRRLGIDAYADSPPLRRALQGRRLRLRSGRLAPRAYQLLDGRPLCLLQTVRCPRGSSRLGDKRSVYRHTPT